jgi:IS5 family transposase
MKAHIGADSRTGIVHHARVAAAHIHDGHEVPNLLLGNETRLDGDRADRGRARRKRLKTLAPKTKDFPPKRACRNRPSSEADNAANRRKPQVRARLEHPFLTHERLRSLAKARHRGLTQNAHRAFAMPARHNLVKWGKPLTGAVRPR